MPFCIRRVVFALDTTRMSHRRTAGASHHYRIATALLSTFNSMRVTQPISTALGAGLLTKRMRGHRMDPGSLGTLLKGRMMNACENRSSRRRRSQGGTIINLITAVVFFGLLALGVLWVIKTVGQAGQQYSTAMIQTSHKASAIKCQNNLRTIWQSVQMYAISDEGLPPTQEALVEHCGYGSRLFHCDEPNAPEYVYIAGQNLDMPATNVLLYEPIPVHDGQCSVLFVGGQIAMLSAEDLKLAVEATIAGLKQRRR